MQTFKKVPLLEHNGGRERDFGGLEETKTKKAWRATHLSSFFTSQPPSTEGEYEKGVLEQRKTKKSPGALIPPRTPLCSHRRGRKKEVSRRR